MGGSTDEAVPLWGVRGGINQMALEIADDQLQLPTPIAGSIVDIKSLGNPPAQDPFLERQKESLFGLVIAELGMRN